MPAYAVAAAFHQRLEADIGIGCCDAQEVSHIPVAESMALAQQRQVVSDDVVGTAYLLFVPLDLKAVRREVGSYAQGSFEDQEVRIPSADQRLDALVNGNGCLAQLDSDSPPIDGFPVRRPWQTIVRGALDVLAHHVGLSVRPGQELIRLVVADDLLGIAIEFDLALEAIGDVAEMSHH